MKQDLLPDNFDFGAGTPLWNVSPNRKSLERKLTFKNFLQAFEFMTLAAQYAEEINHHPDWCNSWNEVRVSLTTQSSGGLTELDLLMALRMNELAEEIQLKG